MRKIALLIGAAVLASGIGFAVSLLGQGNQLPDGVLTSAGLPTDWIVNEITSVRGVPELFAEKPYPPSANPSECALLALDPDSLEVKSTRKVSCSTPSDPGSPTALVIEYVKGPYQMRAHIAHTDSAGHTTVGPSVMAIPFVSDTRAVWAEGRGSDWLYDVATPQGPMLLQISSSTGRVERHIPIPVKLYRPVMVADQAGVWIGLTPGGASGGIGSPIYFVSAKTGNLVLAAKVGISDFWAYAGVTQVWFGANSFLPGAGFVTHLLRFDGSDTHPAENVAITGSLDSLNGIIFGGGVVGDGRSSIWTLTWPGGSPGAGPGCRSAAIQQINLSTGKAKVIAKLPAPTINLYDNCSTLADGEAVVIENRFFVLTGQGGDGSASGYGRINAVSSSQH